MQIALAIGSIYLFILLGYVAKRLFRELDEKSITIMSVYFFQPFLTFWGLTSANLQPTHWHSALLYLLIVALVLGASVFFARRVFSDPKERSIASIAGLVGNTGNLGIPLGIALFGEASVIYTTLINLANVFVVYILGVYIYSRGAFSIKASLLNIIKIPIIPVAVIAIACNYLQITLPKPLMQSVTYGAYTAIVFQLFLFGMYLYRVRIRSLNVRLAVATVAQKFVLLPLMTVAVLWFFPVAGYVKAILFIQLMMPLAVANVNLSSLYDCKPEDVTALVFLTSVLFLGFVFLARLIVEQLYL